MNARYDGRRVDHGYTPLHAMNGPEFNPASVYRPLTALPPGFLLPVLAALILFALGACTGVALTGDRFGPSPNICRVDQFGSAAEQSGACVRPTGAVPR
ncbi:hypothetical protein ACWIGW_21915 [Nocardia brasiliensis]